MPLSNCMRRSVQNIWISLLGWIKYSKTSAGSRSAELPAEDIVRGAHVWSNGRNVLNRKYPRGLWGPTSDRSRLLDHRTISSPVCCRDAKRQRSNSDAQSITCPVFGRRTGTSRLPPPPQKNGTTQRDVTCRDSEAKSTSGSGGQEDSGERKRGFYGGNCSAHEELTSTSPSVEWACSHRASGEARLSQAVRLIRCSSLSSAFTHY